MLILKKFKEVIKNWPAVSFSGIVVLALITWGLISLLSGKDAQSSVQNYTVKEGPLKISITGTGTIQPKEKIIVKNEIEGSTAITYLVEEGIKVKKGDLMIELDSNSLYDKVVDQEIQVQKASASNVAAIENYDVVQNQAQSDIESAQLTYDFAQLDLNKYIEGEYPNALKEAESNIIVAEKDLSIAKDKVEWDRQLYEEKYLSEMELNADNLSYNNKKISVELKKASRDLLVNYTYKRQLAKLQSDVTQAKSALERTIRKAKANVIQAKATKAAKQAEYERQISKLEKYKSQLEKTKIYAPADGSIIYATSAEQSQHRHGSHTEPLEVGNSVKERQELIHLPTASGFVVNMTIPEANLDKIKIGLQTNITVDSIPNVVFTGKVLSISSVVNAQEHSANPDLKVYDTVISIEEGGDLSLLRSGMNSSVEIIIDQYKNAIYVPLQALLNVDGKQTVYLVKGDRLKPRTVETGLYNNSIIRIVSGLEPGDIVSLSPPLAQATVVENLSVMTKTPTVSGTGSDLAPSVTPGDKENSSAGSGNTSGTEGEKKTSGNRYSTTGSVSDSGNSGNSPGGGMPDHDDD